jgi:hypothetical protein
MNYWFNNNYVCDERTVHILSKIFSRAFVKTENLNLILKVYCGASDPLELARSVTSSQISSKEVPRKGQANFKPEPHT